MSTALRIALNVVRASYLARRDPETAAMEIGCATKVRAYAALCRLASESADLRERRETATERSAMNRRLARARFRLSLAWTLRDTARTVAGVERHGCWS